MVCERMQLVVEGSMSQMRAAVPLLVYPRVALAAVTATTSKNGTLKWSFQFLYFPSHGEGNFAMQLTSSRTAFPVQNFRYQNKIQSYVI